MPLRVENQGRATRDFIFVEDIVRGLLLCAREGQPGDVYNLASGVQTSILDLATRINQFTGNTAELEYVATRDWDHSGKRYGSTEKAKRVLGFEAYVKVREGIQRTIEWTRANLQKIDSCIRKHSAHMEAL